MMMAPPPMHDSAVSPCSHGYLAFLHRHFPPQSPPSHPLDVSLCSQQLHNPSTPAPSHCAFQGTCVPVQGMYGCGKDSLILIPFRLPQISYFTLRRKCFSSDSDNCPNVGIRPLVRFPHLPRAGPVLLTLLFFPIVPLFYRVLCDSIYSFPLVRYFYPLSAGVLHVLLCLKCIPGVIMERDVLHVHLLLRLLVLCKRETIEY